MRRHLTSILASAALTALIAAPALAQGGGGGQGAGQGAGQGPGAGQQDRDMDRMRDRASDRDMVRDQDRDRLYLGAKDRLQVHDQDRDGKLSETEFRSWHEGAFASFDNDGNGGFGLDDYKAIRLGPGPKSKNSARALERSELRKTERFRVMDGDGDGVVTRNEYMKFGELHYLDADSNDDGLLTFQELQQFNRNM